MKRVLPWLFLALMLLAIPPTEGEGGAWTGETFEDDLDVELDPPVPTFADEVEVHVNVKSTRDVFLNQVIIVYSFQPPGDPLVDQGPFRMVELAGGEGQRFAWNLGNLPNGTVVNFLLEAFDQFNEPRQSQPHNFTVQGAPVILSWPYETFEGNLNLTYTPMDPEPHEAVVVTIRPNDPLIAVGGAHVQLSYQYLDNPQVGGGFTFQRGENGTLSATIPGYPVGTRVFFFVKAWDQRSGIVDSRIYNYTISLSEYTLNPTDPFPQPEVAFGGVAATALAIPIAMIYFRRRP